MNTSRMASAYTDMGMESEVASANAHKLILMLFEGAVLAISAARIHMAHKEIASKGKSISHAISIIDNGLKASLDLNVGGEIAQNLSSLYDYMSMRLLLSNLNNDADGLEEVRKLLLELKGAWESIATESVREEKSAPRMAASYGKA
ncbi:MAG: flagellar export chaperone FliS [Burkholderiales bacterium]|nr:flagellar export chaperone FliS [Burkholderiales bacterium]